jgi:hypothetical protein
MFYQQNELIVCTSDGLILVEQGDVRAMQLTNEIRIDIDQVPKLIRWLREAVKEIKANG